MLKSSNKKSMSPTRICLFYSNTGGGHRSATLAVEAALHEILERENIADNFQIMSENIVERSHFVNRGFVGLYNFLLRYSQSSVKYYFSFIHFLRPNDSPMGYWLTAPYFKKQLLELKPDVLVSIHPMVNQYLAQVLVEMGLEDQVKLITLVTDPNGSLWRGWACPAAQLTIVPNDVAKQTLLDWGVAPERLQVLGMPVRPPFTKFTGEYEIRRSQFITRLGLKPEFLTVCINAGWAGGGNMMAIFKALNQVKKPIQVIFLTGHNQALYRKASKEAKVLGIPTVVLPFKEDMADLMDAVDLMVTKAGGLTTFEAIARRLPLVIDMLTDPMPQEAGTIEILLTAGLAKAVKSASDIVSIVEQSTRKANRQSLPLPESHSLDKVNAVYDIAREIIECGRPGLLTKLAGDSARKLETREFSAQVVAPRQ
jgi:UDP-N-acetylglucosamine:LPS N-acetylglucosamine transferase